MLYQWQSMILWFGGWGKSRQSNRNEKLEGARQKNLLQVQKT